MSDGQQGVEDLYVSKSSTIPDQDMGDRNRHLIDGNLPIVQGRLKRPDLLTGYRASLVA
jgi:hypothetical protein